MAWTLDEFDTVDLPLLYLPNFELVGSAKTRDYLVQTSGGMFYDAYQDKYGNFEDVPLGRRTLRIDTVALLTGSDNPFTVYDNLRQKVGKRGKLYRKWASVSATLGEEPSDPDILYPRRERQWVWARLIEMPRKRHGTLQWDGSSTDDFGTSTSSLADYSIGHQLVDFIFETVDPYWKNETATVITQSISSATQTTVALTQGELPIQDAVLQIAPGGSWTTFRLVINGPGGTDTISGDNAYSAWTLTPSSAGQTITIDSGKGTVLQTSVNPAVNQYSGMVFNTLLPASPTVARVHNKAPLIYIKGTGLTVDCIVYATGGGVDLTFTYYLSNKE